MSAKLREQAFESLSHLKANGSIDFEITSASVQRLSHSIFLEQLACHWIDHLKPYLGETYQYKKPYSYGWEAFKGFSLSASCDCRRR